MPALRRAFDHWGMGLGVVKGSGVWRSAFDGGDFVHEGADQEEAAAADAHEVFGVVGFLFDAIDVGAGAFVADGGAIELEGDVDLAIAVGGGRSGAPR